MLRGRLRLSIRGGGEKIAGAEHHFHFMRKEFLSDKSL